MAERLSVPDAGWLLIEGRERPMHVGGLMLFRPPPEAGPDFLQDVVTSALGYRDVRPPFDQRLLRPYGFAGAYHWIHEDEVELEYHLRHLALPAPGRIRELLSLVSSLHGSLLDRHRPLWELYLIEGIDGGRFAIYTKVHHSVMDGVASIRQILKSFTPDPDERDLPPPWVLREPATPSGDGGGAFNPLAIAADLVRTVTTGVSSIAGAGAVLASQLAKAPFSATDIAPYQAPACMLNQRLTSTRRFVAQSYELDRIRAAGKALDATINDVVLAMCSSALRRYLIDHRDLPERPLIALVPVSFRHETGGETGNAISLVPANLATHLADPLERLQLIKSSMDTVKERLKGMSAGQLITYGLMMTAPLILGQLTGLAGRLPRPEYNVVISNVPGPSQPMYWNGARMEGLYPLSLLSEGYAVNITQTSYAGSMEFGITADRRAMPSVQRLIDHLEEGLVELEKVAAP